MLQMGAPRERARGCSTVRMWWPMHVEQPGDRYIYVHAEYMTMYYSLIYAGVIDAHGTGKQTHKSLRALGRMDMGQSQLNPYTEQRPQLFSGPA